MPQYAELEIALRRRESGGYPVEMRYVAIGSDTDEHLPAQDAAYADIDPKKLVGLEALGYGKALGSWLFANREILVGFEKARDSLQAAAVQKNIQTLGEPALRVRLYIDAGAQELHQLHWETLCDSNGDPIFQDTDILFSRYLASRNWHAPQGKTDLKALIVIADPRYTNAWDPEEFNPDDDEHQQLAPVDVSAERKRAEDSFKKTGITFQTLATGQENSLGPATLANIMEQLDKGFDILYMVCHGALMRDGRTPERVARLCLEDALTDASRLVEAIRLKMQLRLVVLASCESAGKGSSGTLSAFGPLLVDAGVPAVVAMQGKVKMTTAAKFMPVFLQALGKSGGQIDRAMGEARKAAVSADCDDFWMPVLFMRLRTGRLWYVPGLAPGGENTDDQVWANINRAITNQRCTPILGPGLLDSLIGTTRDLAKELAGNRFPFSPVFREELPTVAQFMAVSYRRSLTAREELAGLIVNKLPALDGVERTVENLSRIMSAAANAKRAVDPSDPHAVLASKPFSIYLTTNPDRILEDALEEAGKHPRSDFSRWNKEAYFDLRNHAKYPTIQEREPSYTPSVAQPLVYHLFGQLDLPQSNESASDPAGFASRVEAGLGSVALTEDDFFSYLLSVGSKSETKEDMPGPVGRALAENSLLFLGFRQDDWSFRVLLRSIFNKEGIDARNVGKESYPCVGAQIQPEEDRVLQPATASKYFEQYFRESKIDIFWGNTEEFVRAFELNTAAFAK